VFNRLYVRIWLAVLLAVAVLTLLVGWIWHISTEPPLREVVVRDVSGQVIGQGRSRHPVTAPGATPGAEHGRNGEHPRRRHRTVVVEPPPPSNTDDDDAVTSAPVPPTGGPEFVVRMADGNTMLMHLPRPQPVPWLRPPFGFFWMLGLVGVAVALATYPIVRKLTQRLERLQHGVERWGQGDLGTRVPVNGQDEVAFLSERFNQAAERIQNLIRARDELLDKQEALLTSQKSLLANASHELRSPLTRIRMGIQLAPGTDADAWKAEVARNISELDQLVGEILLASRLDAQEADLGTIEPIDLLGLAAEECARIQAELDPSACAGRTDALQVNGVGKLLRRAVRNLLENARRHGAGDVSLHMSLENSAGDERDKPSIWVVLQVCDRGPGVPTELAERIFEPFYRLPGATERDGGVGLGLALVKSIAARHNGTVRCRPREGGGACFELRLPGRQHAS